MFAFETVKFTHDLVKMVAAMLEGEIPGAGVVDLMTTEGFFVLSEAVPGVIGVGGGCHAPEIICVIAGGFGVDNHLDNENTTSGEFAMFVGGGSMSVITDAVVIVNEGGSDRNMVEFSNVESGEARFELIAEVIFVLRGEMVAIAEFFEEVGEDVNLFGVFGVADGNAFFGKIAPIADFAVLDTLEEFILSRGEIEHPGVSGIEVVGFFETEFLEKIRG